MSTDTKEDIYTDNANPSLVMQKLRDLTVKTKDTHQTIDFRGGDLWLGKILAGGAFMSASIYLARDELFDGDVLITHSGPNMVFDVRKDHQLDTYEFKAVKCVPDNGVGHEVVCESTPSEPVHAPVVDMKADIAKAITPTPEPGENDGVSKTTPRHSFLTPSPSF